jgi:hypothetical protein
LHISAAKTDMQHFGCMKTKADNTGVSPLRYAPVEMTNDGEALEAVGGGMPATLA